MAENPNPRAIFPDREHPLYSPDPCTQQQVVERIAYAKRGSGRKKRQRLDRNGRPILVIGRGGRRIEDYHKLTNEDVGSALNLGRERARQLMQHPEEMSNTQVELLCGCLEVSLRWLQFGGENDCGPLASDAEMMLLYGRLSDEDRRLVRELVIRLAGDEVVHEVESERFEQLYPEQAAQLRSTVQATMKQFQDAASAIVLTAMRFKPECGEDVESTEPPK